VTITGEYIREKGMPTIEMRGVLALEEDETSETQV